jgi:hypothetical protein
MSGKLRLVGLVAVVVLGVVSAAACGDDDDGSIREVADDGATSLNSSRVEDALEELPEGSLTSNVEAGILFMREEEKLARDVYAQFAKTATQPIFRNIGRSEETHMDTVKVLLERYELEDPAADTETGEFVNDDLQTMYDQLVAQGSQSLEEALRVGALIEEIDIIDLRRLMLETNDPAVHLVYEQLDAGSRNHLRAFVRNLERLGVEYEPARLTQAEFGDIMASND